MLTEDENTKRIQMFAKRIKETPIPPTTGMISYTVGFDFWNAYQDSLKEREELYRMLRKS